jgi:hypothetical protein
MPIEIRLCDTPMKVTVEKGVMVLRFYPKKDNAVYPDQSDFVLKFEDESDKKKLIKILATEHDSIS